MNNSPACFRRSLLRLGLFALMAVSATNASIALADDAPATSATTTNKTEAEKLWKEVKKGTQAPMSPPEWKDKKPTRDEISKFYTAALHSSADRAKDYYTRFPTDTHSDDAHKIEYNLLNIAAQRFGDTTQTARMEGIEKERLKDTKLSKDERFGLRMGATARLTADLPEKMTEFVKSAKELQKDFPEHKEVYDLLLMAATQSEGDSAKSLAQLVVNSPTAPDEAKEQAQGLLKKMDAVGKPLPIQYTAVDGRAVDVTKMSGKVVLVDFWATWCGPCVGEIPNVKATYASLHDKGFEIVGISLDQDKDKLEGFVAENKMPWPQYFDGLGWKNKISMGLGINSIPAMWLVDKKGNLRDLNGRENLEDKVKKMLAE